MMDGKGCKNLSLTTFSNILLHFEYNLNIDMFRLKNLNILGSKAELAALREVLPEATAQAVYSYFHQEDTQC